LGEIKWLTLVLGAGGVGGEVRGEAVGRGVAVGEQRVAHVRAEEGRRAAALRHRHHLDRQVRDVHRERAAHTRFKIYHQAEIVST
jgi:hypothetical protein